MTEENLEQKLKKKREELIEREKKAKKERSRKLNELANKETVSSNNVDYKINLPKKDLSRENHNVGEYKPKYKPGIYDYITAAGGTAIDVIGNLIKNYTGGVVLTIGLVIGGIALKDQVKSIFTPQGYEKLLTEETTNIKGEGGKSGNIVLDHKDFSNTSAVNTSIESKILESEITEIPQYINEEFIIPPNRIYDLNHSIIVNPNGRLIIGECTTLRFKGKPDNNYFNSLGIYVNQGELQILGTENEMVALEAIQDHRNGDITEYWNGISIINSRKNNIIQYAIIKNGQKNEGGGINIQNSNVSIDNSVLWYNKATSRGGGIAVSNNSDVAITNTDIKYSIEGGIDSRNSRMKIRDSNISNNNATWGGGFYNYYSEVYLDGCNIENNNASEGAGGLCNEYAEITLNNTVISNNTSKTGGGMYNFHTIIKKTGNTQISNNKPDNIYEKK